MIEFKYIVGELTESAQRSGAKEGKGWAVREGSDGLGGAVVDQMLSVLRAHRDVVDGHALVLRGLLPSLQEAVHHDAE